MPTKTARPSAACDFPAIGCLRANRFHDYLFAIKPRNQKSQRGRVIFSISAVSRRIATTALLSLVFFCSLTFPSASAATDKPNIIFLLTDDMGYGDCGCYGGKFVPTPYIHRLAKEGTKFTQF